VCIQRSRRLCIRRRWTSGSSSKVGGGSPLSSARIEHWRGRLVPPRRLRRRALLLNGRRSELRPAQSQAPVRAHAAPCRVHRPVSAAAGSLLIVDPISRWRRCEGAEHGEVVERFAAGRQRFGGGRGKRFEILRQLEAIGARRGRGNLRGGPRDRRRARQPVEGDAADQRPSHASGMSQQLVKLGTSGARQERE
jgi:hypothetical protein